MGLSSTIWCDLAAFFVNSKIFLPNLNGHGNNIFFEKDLTFRDIWANLKNDLNKNRISKTSLVLHSMSASLLPEIINEKILPFSIILIEGNIIENDVIWSSNIKNMNSNEYNLWFSKYKKNSTIIMRSQLIGDYDIDKIKLWSAGMNQVRSDALKIIASMNYKRTISGEVLKSLSRSGIPILYIRGYKSPKWHEGFELLKKMKIPFVKVPNSSHYPMIENPKFLHETIVNFNRSI